MEFAIGNAALFQLMFRVERLNAGHERLRAARAGAFAVITEATRCHGSCAWPDAGRHERFFRVVGNGIFVDGDISTDQRGLGPFTGDLLGAETIDYDSVLRSHPFT